MSNQPTYTKHKYSSGNEGRHHPGMVHDGHFGPRTPYVNVRRLALQREWMKGRS